MPTAFNFLGPLTNPARVDRRGDRLRRPRMAPVMAAVLAERGDTALVFRGDDGLDELTTTTTSSVWVAADGDGAPSRRSTRPRSASRRCARRRCAAATASFNAAVVRDVLGRRRRRGVRDAVLLNAAAAIAAYDGLGGRRAATTRSRRGAAAGRARPSTPARRPTLLDRWVDASQRGPRPAEPPRAGGYWTR